MCLTVTPWRQKKIPSKVKKWLLKTIGRTQKRLSLNIQWSSVKWVIMEEIWQMCNYARPSSQTEWPGEKETSKEAAKTAIATLKALKASAALMGETAYNKFCCFFNSQIFMGEWQRERKFPLGFIQRHLGHSSANWKSLLSDETKMKPFLPLH